MFPIMTTVATRYAPFVTWSLIVINTFVFLGEVSLPENAQQAFVQQYALIPARYYIPQWAAEHGLGSCYYLPFISNVFMHGGWLHLIMNMWTLLIFGPAVEDRLGGTRFLVFYLFCGIGASAAHAYVNATSLIPALGASGAIAGVMGAYLRLFPLSRMLVMIPIFIFPFFFEMHAAIFIGIWVAIQLAQGIGGLMSGMVDLSGGIAWWAHIGGFAAGWFAISFIRHGMHLYRVYHRDEGILGFLPNGQRTGKGPWT